MYCVSCRMLARSARNAAPPTSSSGVASARARRRRDDRLERREHALAVGLAERNEPHAGRNQICGDGVQIGVQRRLKRDAVARRPRRRPRPDRRPARPRPPQAGRARRKASRARRLDEGAALRGRFQMALLRGREGGGKLGDGRAAPCRRRPSIARCACTKNTASQKPPPSRDHHGEPALAASRHP